MLRYVLDTHLLIYCFDDRDTVKQTHALELIRRVGAAPSAALPAQVLAEFASVALRRLDPPLSPDEVYRQLALYMRIKS